MTPIPSPRPLRVRSFAPVVNAASRVLILGSMPGAASLRAREYYAHPRNLFWPLMETLAGVPRAAPYPERLAQLLARGIGLWDVLESCTRASSLDSDIVEASIVANDFARLFAAFPSIEIVCFNGGKAAAAFRKHVLPSLAGVNGVAFHDLPSTSPANASIAYEKKLAAWRARVRAASGERATAQRRSRRA
ncbi:MAG TPA: DNA-deoxyinosine glycosylase [Myxococcota bacterium]|nr:DNA-deoxyinosine glycosylase [Myxococcota bacterium]